MLTKLLAVRVQFNIDKILPKFLDGSAVCSTRSNSESVLGTVLRMEATQLYWTSACNTMSRRKKCLSSMTPVLMKVMWDDNPQKGKHSQVCDNELRNYSGTSLIQTR